MKWISSLLIVITACNYCFSQEYYREYGVSDSTKYFLSADSTIIAGNKTLYLETSSGIQTIHQFSISNPDYFLRDFNAIRSDLWYAVIGSRYIANTTTLLTSQDQGQTWDEDTSFYAAAKPTLGLIADYQSISQMQAISEDTLLLFISYYQAGIFYSTNAGTSWRFWFANTPAHYQGLFECDSSYYLYGIEGDAFPASMFKFSKDLLLSPDTGGAWQHFGTGFHPPCFNSGDPDCIYAPNGARHSQFTYFQNYVDSACSSISLIEPTIEGAKFEVYPNPAKDEITILTPKLTNGHLFGFNGKVFMTFDLIQGENQISVEGLPPGLYLLQVFNPGRDEFRKLIIKD